MNYPHMIKNADRGKSRTLWEQVFTEDGPEWLDMYYDLRADNVILGIFSDETDDSILTSMLHLNPFKLNFGSGFAPVDASYIVGVSTLPEFRHRGLMRTLLGDALKTEAQEGRPLIFLMPANEAIYTPFGFRTVYDQSNLLMDPALADTFSPDASAANVSEPAYTTKPAEKEHSTLLAALSTEILGPSTDVFALRDPAYFDFLITEMAVEDGETRIIYKGEEPVGYFCFWPSENGAPIVVRELVAKDCDAVSEALGLLPAKSAPKIMIRVLDVTAFLKPLISDTPLCIVLNYKDDILEEYSGKWLVHVGPDGTSAERLSQTSHPSEDAISLSLTCEELVLWMFGKAELPEEKTSPELCNIKRPTRILINEWI